MKARINIRLTIDYASHPKWEDPHIRLISKWSNCITTEAMKEGVSSWTIDGDTPVQSNDKKGAAHNPVVPFAERNAPVVGTWSQEISIPLATDDEIAQMNSCPFITAVLLASFEKKIKMITFATLDCSALLIHEGSVSCRSPSREGAFLDLKLVASEPFLPQNKLLSLEPLELNLQSFDAFPIEHDIPPEETLKSSYIYGLFDFGEGFQRIIFGYPLGDQYVHKQHNLSSSLPIGTLNEQTLSSEYQQILLPIDYKTCILSGLHEKLKFHDRLTSSTFILQIHTDDLCERIFTSLNMSEYNERYVTQLSLPVVEQDVTTKQPSPRGNTKKNNTKGGGGAAAGSSTTPSASASSSASSPSLVHPISEKYQEKDDLIWGWITTALSNSPRLMSYGSIRCRLDSVLNTSTDRLLEFQALQNHQKNGDLAVTISDEKILEVLPTRPSNPSRWHMPSDISLKSALTRAKELKLQQTTQLHDTLQLLSQSGEQTREQFNETFNSTTSTTTALNKTTTQSTQKLQKKYRNKLFELYKDCGTVLNLSVALHRKYHQNEIQPSVLPPSIARSVSSSTSPSSPTKSTPPPHPPSTKQSKSSTHQLNNQPIESLLERRLRITPYARMVFIFKYDDNETLNLINDAIISVNSKALPNIQGTLRSYSFTKEEIILSDAGELDVICGFSIIDDEMRMIVIEGLGGIGLGMQEIFSNIPRRRENDKNLTILCNPEVLFPQRLYTIFGPDLKRVRPREKLKKLAKKSEIYNRKQVDIECFEAIDKLMSLRTCPDLKTTKELDCYPSPEAIQKLELLYGDALSKEDLDGTQLSSHSVGSSESHQMKDSKGARGGAAAGGAGGAGGGGDLLENSFVTSTSLFDPPSLTHHSRSKRLQPTDSHNPNFEEIIRSRDPNVPRVDRLQEQRNIRKAAWAQALNRLAQREEEDAAIIAKVYGEDHKGVKIHCYSGQSQNFTEMLQRQNRKELVGIKGSTFTYSKEFLSQSVVLVDEESDRKTIKEIERNKWTTKRGFQYPPIKTRKELIQHPKRPHEARIEDLKQSYEHFDDQRLEDPTLKEKESSFKIPALGGDYFGMLNPPVYSQEFELKNIGHRTILPRGNMVAGKDQNELFWQSVHLSGEASAKAQEEALEAEKKAWSEKVVVDTLDFKVGGYKVRDRPLQLDRTNDILKDEPKDKSLIHLRQMKTATGKDISFGPTPLTIMNTGEYIPNAMEKSLLRSVQPDKFLTTQQTGTAVDFTRYIHKGVGKPPQQTIISKKRHPPIQDHEKSGPRWEGASGGI